MWQVLVLILLQISVDLCGGNRPPVFLKSINLAVIQENTPIGTSVFQLVGSDPENSTLTYGIEGTKHLSVDRQSGVVTVADNIDREENDSLKFFITLEDVVGGVEENNLVRSPVTVIIIDENDNAPVFQNQPYEISVRENVPPGTKVLEGVTVTDADDVGGVLQIRCEPYLQYLEACEKFSIAMDSIGSQKSIATLVSRKKLLYSERHDYKLHLTADDGRFNSTALVIITVEDVQNRPPVFLGSLTGIVQEDALLGTLVMKVAARDGDEGYERNIIYELLSNPGGYFAVNQNTGEVRTTKPLDREVFASSNGVVSVAIKASEIEKDGSLPSGDEAPEEWSSTAAISITIRDVNDEAPSFNKVSYTVQVNENVAEGTPLPNLDMFIEDTDTGSNSVFNIELLDESGIFSVEPPLATGSTSVSIRVANEPLDYENPNQRKFILLVIAKEAFAKPQLSSTGTVTVNIADINDNTPVFEKSEYRATILETAPAGTVVDTITATDRDTGIFGEAGIRYSLFGNGAERFHVSASSGVITVSPCATPGSSNCLDYETRSTYYLSYQAVDEDGRGHAAVVPLTISLSDANDNAPVFLHDSYSANIDEGATKFDSPLRVQAIDADATSILLYSIIAGNEHKLFSIDGRSGEVTVTQPDGLDISAIRTNWIVLTVQVTDEGKGNVTTTVKITVKDANNNRPVFEKTRYSAVVSESALSATIVEQVSANDADTGVNAEISYRIQRGGFDDFEIDGTTGRVTVNTGARLDYDRRNEYNVEIIAVDGGSPVYTGTTTLVVHVLNSNDKSPYFTPSTQRTQVTEGEDVGHIFYKLQAKDPDVSSSDALSFAVARPVSAIDKDGRQLPDASPAPYEDFFSVSPSTGEIRVATRLDREMAAIVTMTVLVIDSSATPPQTGTGTLVVTIIDLNDYPPAFGRPWSPENPRLTIHVMEEQPIGSVVATLVATDQDSNIAGYYIEPENPYFTINNSSGVISVKSRVDYEAVRQIEFRVMVFDTGLPQLSAYAIVTANVMNINDNDPVFDRPSYHASLKENSPQGTMVIQIQAVDADEGDFGKIRFSLLGEKSQDFIVDQKGVIRVAAAATLDHEITPTVTLQAVATDQGSDVNTRRSTSVPVYINLEDLNDNPPIFSQREYEGTLVSGLPLSPPTSVVQLFADDKDLGLHARLKFSLFEGNEKGVFDINTDTGVIYPVKEEEEGIKSYILKVRVSNEQEEDRLFDEAVVRIRVVEINMAKPKFIVPALPNASVEISENQRIENFLVMNLSAEDKDRGENGRVSYFLKVGNSNVEETREFKINPVTGELRTKTFLDREKTSKYQLVLAAKDNGSPHAFESLSFLTVHVKDIDDNNPAFPRTQTTNPYVFTLMENMPKNYAIGRVAAEDPDEAENALIFYYIIDGNYGGYFQVEKTSGVIRSNASYDRELRSSYEVIIKASSDPDYTVYERAEESGFSARQRSYREEDLTLALVRILIADVNDNPPKFSNEPYIKGIKLSTQVGDVVLSVLASDPDDGDNGSFEYRIDNIQLYRPGVTGSVRPVPSPFNITSEGHLVSNQLMARYDHARFVLTVAAREVVEPYHSTKTTVKLWVYEANQLIRVIIAQPPEEVNKKKKLVNEILSNATRGTVVIDDIRYHVNEKNILVRKWTDLFVHVVNDQDEMMLISQVLEAVDSSSKLLSSHRDYLKVHKIVPAYADLIREEFDLALLALISLLVVIFVGIITMIVCCMCLKKWYSTKMHEVLVRHEDEGGAGNTTENPLWTEQKLKLYEEQELSMTVSPDHPSDVRQRQIVSEIAITDDDADSAMYATLRKSTDGSRMGTFRQLQPGQANEYATLNGCYSRAECSAAELSPSSEDNLLVPNGDTEGHEYHELQCRSGDEAIETTTRFKNDVNSSSCGISPVSFTIDNKGEPVLVTELL